MKQATGNHNKSHTIWRFAVSLILIAASAWLFVNRQDVHDRIVLARYEPDQRIEQLANDTTMTNVGKRYFYVSKPEINGRDQFNDNCGSKTEQTIILGCYADKQIYLFEVTDDRLPGVMEVTAAHEMLHVGYERISKTEKDRINKLIEVEVERIDDERIKGLIDIYNKREPGQLLNEMHSILATEVARLPSELEQYYKRYFKNRQAVVGYSKQYESVFVQLRQTQKRLVQKLEGLEQEISNRTSQLNAEIARLNADIERFNNRARSGGFSSQEEFDRQRNDLQARQYNLKLESEAINSLIKEFNSIRDQLLDLNVQVQSLNQILDSTPEEIQELH